MILNLDGIKEEHFYVWSLNSISFNEINCKQLVAQISLINLSLLSTREEKKKIGTFAPPNHYKTRVILVPSYPFCNESLYQYFL